MLGAMLADAERFAIGEEKFATLVMDESKVESGVNGADAVRLPSEAAVAIPSKDEAAAVVFAIAGEEELEMLVAVIFALVKSASG